MTHQKWAHAAQMYNARLEERSEAKGFEFIKKNPQALGKKNSSQRFSIEYPEQLHMYACT